MLFSKDDASRERAGRISAKCQIYHVLGIENNLSGAIILRGTVSFYPVDEFFARDLDPSLCSIDQGFCDRGGGEAVRLPRPYIRSLFPDWEDKVEYWRIQDLDVAGADEVLPELEAKVVALVNQLAKKHR